MLLRYRLFTIEHVTGTMRFLYDHFVKCNASRCMHLLCPVRDPVSDESCHKVDLDRRLCTKRLCCEISDRPGKKAIYCAIHDRNFHARVVPVKLIGMTRVLRRCRRLRLAPIVKPTISKHCCTTFYYNSP